MIPRDHLWAIVKQDRWHRTEFAEGSNEKYTKPTKNEMSYHRDHMSRFLYLGHLDHIFRYIYQFSFAISLYLSIFCHIGIWIVTYELFNRNLIKKNT